MEIQDIAETDGKERDSVTKLRGGGIATFSLLLRKVMEELLNVSVPEGGFVPAPDVQGGPVSNEEVLENIRKSAEIDVPLFCKKPKREGTMVYIGAGPSMKDHIDEIKERYEKGDYIITSNLTYDFLLSHDVIANAVLIIDPKEIVATYIKNPRKETQFYVGVVCNPDVAKGLIGKGMNVEKVLVGYGIEDESDIQLQKELYGKDKKDFLVGGTMTGLRVMNFAILLGFKHMEYYGLDSCFSGDMPRLIYEDNPEFKKMKHKNKAYYEDIQTNKKYILDEPNDGGFFYAYKKKHNGNIQVAMTPDGRRFITTPVFAHQAKQFIKWYDRLEKKLDITLHGDNLTSHLLKCHLADVEKKKATIGDKRWSDKYYPSLKEFFSRGNHVSISKQTQEILDYSETALQESLKREPIKFDYDKNFMNEIEGKFDMVTCLNLMEHIEVECIENVIKHIREHSKYMVIIHVSFEDTKDLLENDKPSHLHHKSGEWWREILEKYFMVTEGMWVGGGYATFICQSYDAPEFLKEEVL